MDAGSSCFCLLCHPSAKACQFHYHASATRVGRRPGPPKKLKKNYVFICAHACAKKPPKHHASPTCQTSKRWFGLPPLLMEVKNLSCVHRRAGSVYVSARPHGPTLSFTHTHKNVCVHGASVNDGWQYDVCVRSKRIGITTWARSAANSSRLLTKLFLCLLFFPVFFFFPFFLGGAKQLMVCLWETSKLCFSGKHMHSDAKWKRSDDIVTGCCNSDL